MRISSSPFMLEKRLLTPETRDKLALWRHQFPVLIFAVCVYSDFLEVKKQIIDVCVTFLANLQLLEIVEFSTVGSWDQHTCDNILVCHHAFQMSRAQIIKCVISGSKKSIVAWPAQLVHHTGSQCCSLGEGKCIINSPLMFFSSFSKYVHHPSCSVYVRWRKRVHPFHPGRL